ncbi:dihydroxyacetone kinase subunit DhaL [Caldibacillus lycopersici]|uniref:phosphoenolpyruvate--glycerone phosphotransferase n=1 Tax=Perspicuibacillus lycopersici TaxID=1325689 RepID=A0AAE3LM89_9BACI|nr:dihydroxyacetone kinase subunit DhaL [Perspicuibacillus lycopersici]MCU9612701.1 dihydroxyacetone kinase subunit DhaL [Perspicuibacillus lycopersici]
MTLTVETAIKWLHFVNEEIQANKEYLTDLDQAIGDGDHGLNMARGFQEVSLKLNTANYNDLASLFKDVGMTLLSKVGGASGPLYGTAFMRLSMALKDKSKATQSEFSEGLQAALNGLKMRGKAQLGDKTMIDVWEPVVEFLKNHEQVTGKQLADLAKEKMEATKDIEAKKGRAAYLGKRSIGHLDPGAVSSYLLFSSLSRTFSEGEI